VECDSWIPESSFTLKTVPDKLLQPLSCIANAYRNALIIFLHSIIDLMLDPETGYLSIYQEGIIRQLIPVTKSTASLRCLIDIASIPDGLPCEAGLLPILFLIACETNREDEFDAAFQRIVKLERNVGIGNIQTARKMLELINRRKMCPGRPRNWRYIMRESAWDLIVS
jgi:hypothetical protein